LNQIATFSRCSTGEKQGIMGDFKGLFKGSKEKFAMLVISIFGEAYKGASKVIFIV